MQQEYRVYQERDPGCPLAGGRSAERPGQLFHRNGPWIPVEGQALLESGSALLNIVGLEPKYETITYFICILSSIFLVVAAMLSFIAIFAVKTSKWITLVSFNRENLLGNISIKLET